MGRDNGQKLVQGMPNIKPNIKSLLILSDLVKNKNLSTEGILENSNTSTTHRCMYGANKDGGTYPLVLSPHSPDQYLNSLTSSFWSFALRR